MDTAHNEVKRSISTLERASFFWPFTALYTPSLDASYKHLCIFYELKQNDILASGDAVY